MSYAVTTGLNNNVISHFALCNFQCTQHQIRRVGSCASGGNDEQFIIDEQGVIASTGLSGALSKGN
jgi:hypothetical protein